MKMTTEARRAHPPVEFVVVGAGGVRPVVQQELAQTLHGQHVERTLARVDQLREPRHRLRRALQREKAEIRSETQELTAPSGVHEC